MGTIIMIGVIALTLGGAFWSYNHSQQAIGRAEAVAEYERQQKEAEQANALRALEGERYANELLDKALARNRAQAAQLVASRKQREMENEARAKVDPVYRDWSNEPVPLYAVSRLRERAHSITATAGSSPLPAQSGVEIAPETSADTGAPTESWITRLRRSAARITGGRVE